MERIRSKSYYKLLILLLGLSLAAYANAQSEYYSVSSNKLTHYLGIALGGGEANRLQPRNEAIKNKAGAAAAFALHYEMQYRSWMWGFGLEGAYQLLMDQANAFSDGFDRLDIDGEMVNYEYVYTSYKETNNTAHLRIPLYVGKRFKGVYTMLGVRFEIPLMARYRVATTMHTQGTYPWSISPIVSDEINDFSSLGFYPKQEYAYADTYSEKMHIAPFVEVGYEFYRTDKVNMRVGAYGAYALPLSKMADRKPLADYSSIDTNPKTQTQANMEQHIAWNPLADSDKYLSAPHRLEVGVKLTMLFNVTVENHKCMCVK